MGRRKKNILDVEIISMANEGKGLGRKDGKVIFVDYALPGDIVDVVVTKNKKDFCLGKIQTIKQPSKLRKAPFCDHFQLCGGCRWQHTDYLNQLNFKETIVEEAFLRIGKLPFEKINTIIPNKSTEFYRNKIEYTFSNRSWLTIDQIKSEATFDRRALGFHVPGAFQKIVDIDKCYLQHENSNAIRNNFKNFARSKNYSFYDVNTHKGFLRNLIIRNSSLNEWMLILIVGEADKSAIEACMEFFKVSFPFLTSINFVINQKKNDSIFDLEIQNYAGKDHIIEQLGDITYKIGPKSFFQTNSQQAIVLYDLIKKYAQIKPTDIVYDLYTGIGSIACYLAAACKKIVGIEQIDAAIEDAKINAELNQLNNTSFYSGEVEHLFDDEFISENGIPDVIITDPPRAGMHKNVTLKILELSPNRIVYVSCNPATQARDLQILMDLYTIKQIQPVDMFPHTFHVENIVLLEKK